MQPELQENPENTESQVIECLRGEALWKPRFVATYAAVLNEWVAHVERGEPTEIAVGAE